jgi:Virulence-associated protein E-like domain
MTDDEYKNYIDRVILEIAEHPDHQTADRIAARLVVPHPENDRVMLIAKTTCKITPTQFDAALNRRRKAQESEAQAAVLRTRNETLVGCNPSTEREFVAAMVRDLTMDYGRTFADADGHKQDIETVLRNIQLTAADLGLTKAPLDLRDKNFERALAELCDKRRAERKAAVWDQISRLSDGRAKESVQAKFTLMCQRYFKQPAFAEAALKKVIWQVKAKMQGGYIKHHHAVILFGGQDTGKSWFWNMVSQPVRDLSKVIDVAELVGESQLDLYNYFLIDLDEMAHSEKADIAKLKSLITKQTVSRRV